MTGQKVPGAFPLKFKIIVHKKIHNATIMKLLLSTGPKKTYLISLSIILSNLFLSIGLEIDSSKLKSKKSSISARIVYTTC